MAHQKKEDRLVNQCKITQMIIHRVVFRVYTWNKVDKLLYNISDPFQLSLPPYTARKLLKIPWVFRMYKRRCMPSHILTKKARLWVKKKSYIFM